MNAGRDNPLIIAPPNPPRYPVSISVTNKTDAVLNFNSCN